MFRDQSRAVAAKITGDAADSTKGQHGSTPTPSSMSNDRSCVQFVRAGAGSTAQLRSLGLNKDHALIDFFANNFTCSNSIGMRDNLFWIPRDFDGALQNDCVKFSAQAVGAMALTRLLHSPQYVAEAHERYSMALLSLAAFGRGGTESKRDAFSLAAMFLGFFEILESSDKGSRLSWKTHLSGLASLFESCDDLYLHTDFGARVFRQTRSQVLIHALQSYTPVPEKFASLIQVDQHDTLSHFMPFDDADRLLARLANLQAMQRAHGPSSMTLAELLALNKSCWLWMETLPPNWSFSRQPVKYQSESWWDAREDVYSSGFIAHTWCKVRAVMIVVYDLVQESFEALPDAQAEAASQVECQLRYGPTIGRTQQVATDICATVPAYYRPSTAAFRASARGNPPALGATFWLFWVLEIVGSMREAPFELTAWIVGCLDRAYHATGIVKVHLVAERLRAGYRGPILP